jgi:hypothetical protein
MLFFLPTEPAQAWKVAEHTESDDERETAAAETEIGQLLEPGRAGWMNPVVQEREQTERQAGGRQWIQRQRDSRRAPQKGMKSAQ